MGILEDIAAPLTEIASSTSTSVLVAASVIALLVVSVVVNVLSQLLFKNQNEPPLVFHWFPLIGNTVTYGMDPFKFFFACREKVHSNTVCS